MSDGVDLLICKKILVKKLSDKYDPDAKLEIVDDYVTSQIRLKDNGQTDIDELLRAGFSEVKIMDSKFVETLRDEYKVFSTKLANKYDNFLSEFRLSAELDSKMKRTEMQKKFAYEINIAVSISNIPEYVYNEYNISKNIGSIAKSVSDDFEGITYIGGYEDLVKKHNKDKNTIDLRFEFKILFFKKMTVLAKYTKKLSAIDLLSNAAFLNELAQSPIYTENLTGHTFRFAKISSGSVVEIDKRDVLVNRGDYLISSTKAESEIHHIAEDDLKKYALLGKAAA